MDDLGIELIIRANDEIAYFRFLGIRADRRESLHQHKVRTVTVLVAGN